MSLYAFHLGQIISTVLGQNGAEFRKICGFTLSMVKQL
jgi:hypothetical protein